ncbi:MAG: hypothetical protein OIF50_09845 [Flavobacteriaceae bacterium]|nr:hypothetical protein [Flavobacteriaceae bacterium]
MNWWQQKYKQNLGIYSIDITEDGDQCTTTVAKSLYAANLLKNNHGTIPYLPIEFVGMMISSAFNTAGKRTNKGLFALFDGISFHI